MNVPDLTESRKRIDAIDRELVRLFEERMEVSRDVARYKQLHHLEVLNTAREEAVLKSRAELAKDPYLKESVVSFFTEIMRLSRQEQYRFLESGLKADCIGYMGIPGAFSESATIGFFGAEIRRRCYDSFESVFAAVADDQVRYGVVPVENSSSGAIHAVYDLLGKYACHIVGEQLVHVEHCLLGLPGSRLEDIQKVYSHEQGFVQCQPFLKQHPQMTAIPYYNTAIAAKHVAEMQDSSCAAIASTLAAEHYGLTVLAPSIQSSTTNATRFFIVSASPRPIGVADKATITFSLKHARGTLQRALSSFVALGMNLTHIESRPIPGTNWEYCFYVDLTGDLSQNNLRVLMQSLEADVASCRLVGTYAAAKEETVP